MKNNAQKPLKSITKTITEACLCLSCIFLSFTASAQDPTADDWITPVGSLTTSINLAAPTPGIIKVTKTNAGVGNIEDILDVRMSDSPNDFFKIMNGTWVDGRFVPSLVGYNGTESRVAFGITGGIPNTMDVATSGPVMRFDSRIWNTGPVLNRPLFSWSSFNIDHMGMAANGDLSVGTAATPNNARLFVYKPINPTFRLQATSLTTGSALEIGVATCNGCFGTTARNGDAVIRQLAGSGGGNGDLILNIPANVSASALTRAVRIADNVNDIFSVFNAGSLGYGRVAIGSGFLPTEQLHTNKGVRFEGLTTGTGNVVVADINGKLWKSTASALNLNCSNVNFVPRVSALNTLDCGVIQDNATNVGIGGPPVAGYRLTIWGNSQSLSDKNYKKNFEPLNNALAKVKQMKAWYYNWDTQKHPDMGLSDTRQLGFVAQEVGNIIPEAISKTPEGTVLMNYNAILPVLTEAIKEQAATIEAQKETIESLEERISRLETALDKLLGQDTKSLKGSFKLEQNAPNPFSDKTVIAYELPQNMTKAHIIITDLSGKNIKTIQLNDCCGEITLSAHDLAEGTFVYSLIANGKVLKTNKMVVAKN